MKVCCFQSFQITMENIYLEMYSVINTYMSESIYLMPSRWPLVLKRKPTGHSPESQIIGHHMWSILLLLDVQSTITQQTIQLHGHDLAPGEDKLQETCIWSLKSRCQDNANVSDDHCVFEWAVIVCSCYVTSSFISEQVCCCQYYWDFFFKSLLQCCGHLCCHHYPFALVLVLQALTLLKHNSLSSLQWQGFQCHCCPWGLSTDNNVAWQPCHTVLCKNINLNTCFSTYIK